MARRSERTLQAIENYVSLRKAGMSPQEIAKHCNLSDKHLYKLIPEVMAAHPELPKEFFYEVPALAGSREAMTTIRETKERPDLNGLDQLLVNCHALLERADITLKEVKVSD